MDKQDLMIKEFLTKSKSEIGNDCFTQNVMLSLPQRTSNKGWILFIGIINVIFSLSVIAGIFCLTEYEIWAKIHNFVQAGFHSTWAILATYKEQLLLMYLYFASLGIAGIISAYIITHQHKNNETISGTA